MPYTLKEPPEWLKDLPEGAIRIGIEVFNSVFEAGRMSNLPDQQNGEKSRRAAWAAIKAQYEKGEDGEWRAKECAGDQERAGAIRFRASRQATEDGLTWEAVLIAPGISLGHPRFYWSEEVLEAAAPVFERVDINAYELTTDFFSHLPIPSVDLMEDVKRYLVAKKVGWVDKTWYEPGVGIKGLIKFLPEQSWIPRTIGQGMDQGNDRVLGLSIDSRVRGMEVVVDNDLPVMWVTTIVSASSVDVVTSPAAGGKFLRAVAGLHNPGTAGKEKTMDREKFIAMIQQHRPDLLAGKDVPTLSEDEVLALARMAMTAADGGGTASPGLTGEQIEEMIAKATKDQEVRAACGRMLDAGLVGSSLPAQAAERVRARFDGKTFAQEDLDKAIKDEQEYLAAMAQSLAQPRWGNQARATGGLAMRDKLEMAVDLLFGLTPDNITQLRGMRRLDGRPTFENMRAAQDYDALTGIPIPTGIRELYTLLTGDPEVTGRFNRAELPADLRAAQDINSATFTYVLGNTLGRRMVADYLATNYGEDMLISIRKPVRDFRTQEAVLVGYFPDLSTVDPEAADYAEISGVTDEESSYAVAQKGNILTITRKTIINDDISMVQRLVSRLGRAARRTHAKYVWAFFTDNANCSDGTAWFTGGHGNLTTSALSIATALAAYQALGKMTEKDSAERIGLLSDPSVKPTLFYPIDLIATAESIVEDEYYFATNDLTTKTRNPLRGKIAGQMVSLFTDTTDWGLVLPASVIDIVEMGYLNGRTEPEMFLADSPQAEQVFVADKIRHKIRHEYAGAVIDFRSGYKGVVA